jgi:predicted pyridoxine 5'-phosphate oxidase superfamily flavin-nucleotide-binding protein
MNASTTDVAFTEAVKALQSRHGSRHAYARLEARGGWGDSLTPDLAAFIAERDAFFFATANAQGQPYVQHRGGARGFLAVQDPRTLAFADYRGNRQYITAGNLAVNDRAFVFLIDYATRQRVKLWGRARVLEDDAEALAVLRLPAGEAARAERAIVFTLTAWDANCPRHIPHLVPAAEVERTVRGLEARIAALEAQLAAA